MPEFYEVTMTKARHCGHCTKLSWCLIQLMLKCMTLETSFPTLVAFSTITWLFGWQLNCAVYFICSMYMYMCCKFDNFRHRRKVLSN